MHIYNNDEISEAMYECNECRQSAMMLVSDIRSTRIKQPPSTELQWFQC